ncbi:AmmeMemoRadiSam system protein A [Gulosibacter macacae]|uniref:AmmeMemoRadiSam system protein A n=1 Tax=Gulosibacter macacae TaxID=2488791 RepID=A0A3P3VSN7_9MICO|nr:AmmeMemoRadiSam system protein A [Gulosibacter macacae]RRJ85812.1 AmmeMemoRadiSam system protein A [Gulosibacter macacae]
MDHGTILLAIARSTIANELGVHAPMPARDDALRKPGASFVSLSIDGKLRGCIGTLRAYRDLGDDVAENAIAAAFQDPRFGPLQRSELDQIRIEVSELTEPKAIGYDGTRAGAIAALRPGVDGVVLHAGRHRATFLPQVWQSLPDPNQFLSHLLAKAGLDPNTWPADTTLERYGVSSWQEP